MIRQEALDEAMRSFLLPYPTPVGPTRTTKAYALVPCGADATLNPGVIRLSRETAGWLSRVLAFGVVSQFRRADSSIHRGYTTDLYRDGVGVTFASADACVILPNGPVVGLYDLISLAYALFMFSQGTEPRPGEWGPLPFVWKHLILDKCFDLDYCR